MHARQRLCLLGLALALALLCVWLTPLPRQESTKVNPQEPVEPMKVASTPPMEAAFEQIWIGMPEEELNALMDPYEEWNTGHHQWREWGEAHVSVGVTLSIPGSSRVLKKSIHKEMFDASQGRWVNDPSSDDDMVIPIRKAGAKPSAVPDDPYFETPDARKAPAPLEGTWEVIGGRLAGDEIPLKGTQFHFRGGELTWRKDNHIELRQKYTIDPKANPMAIDLVSELRGDSFKDRAWEGIYRIDGDRLKICLPISDRSLGRPTEFRAGVRSNRMVLILKRVEE